MGWCRNSFSAATFSLKQHFRLCFRPDLDIPGRRSCFLWTWEKHKCVFSLPCAAWAICRQFMHWKASRLSTTENPKLPRRNLPSYQTKVGFPALSLQLLSVGAVSCPVFQTFGHSVTACWKIHAIAAWQALSCHYRKIWSKVFVSLMQVARQHCLFIDRAVLSSKYSCRTWSMLRCSSAAEVAHRQGAFLGTAFSDSKRDLGVWVFLCTVQETLRRLSCGI